MKSVLNDSKLAKFVGKCFQRRSPYYYGSPSGYLVKEGDMVTVSDRYTVYRFNVRQYPKTLAVLLGTEEYNNEGSISDKNRQIQEFWLRCAKDSSVLGKATPWIYRSASGSILSLSSDVYHLVYEANLNSGETIRFCFTKDIFDIVDDSQGEVYITDSRTVVIRVDGEPIAMLQASDIALEDLPVIRKKEAAD